MPKPKYVWVEWRETWAAGPSEWKAEEVVWYDDLVKELKTHFECRCNDYSYSEMFRGIEWNVIERPTRQLLEKKIQHTKDDIVALEHDLARFEALSKKIPKKDRWVYKDRAYTSEKRMNEVMLRDARYAEAMSR